VPCVAPSGSITMQSVPPPSRSGLYGLFVLAGLANVFSYVSICRAAAVRVVDIERLPFGVKVYGGGSSSAVACAGVLVASKRS